MHAMVAGASHIDHADLLRAGATAEVLPPGDGAVHVGHVPAVVHLRPRPPVRAGHRLALGAAWAQGAGPGGERLVVDIDSTIDEVHGKLKAGAAFGYTKKLGYHPMNRPGFVGGSSFGFLRPRWAENGDGSRPRLRPACGRRARSGAAPR